MAADLPEVRHRLDALPGAEGGLEVGPIAPFFGRIVEACQDFALAVGEGVRVFQQGLRLDAGEVRLHHGPGAYLIQPRGNGRLDHAVAVQVVAGPDDPGHGVGQVGLDVDTGQLGQVTHPAEPPAQGGDTVDLLSPRLAHQAIFFR